MTLMAELEFRSHLLERLVDKVVSAGIDDIIASFVRRAQRLYGPVDRPIDNLTEVSRPNAVQTFKPRRRSRPGM